LSAFLIRLDPLPAAPAIPAMAAVVFAALFVLGLRPLLRTVLELTASPNDRFAMDDGPPAHEIP
jgi:hypothetical protein